VWNCSKCAETIEDTFDACWNCGTSRDGSPDIGFIREGDAVAADAHGPDLLFLERGWLKTVWRFVAAPPREDVPRWLSRCCTVVLLVAASFSLAVLADYALRVEPAVQQAIRDHEAKYPNSDNPNIIVLGSAIYFAMVYAVAIFVAVLTLATWRYHGIWTKMAGFSPLPLTVLIAFIEKIAPGI